MQVAYRPETPRTAEQNLLFEPGHTVVLWTPERLNLSDRKVGVQFVEARHFVFLTDQTFRVLDTSERMFTSDPVEKQGIVSETKYAHNCAFEILLRHEARGVVIIESLCDTSPAKVQLLEDKLARLGWFEAPTMGDLAEILDRITPSDVKEEEAVNKLRIAIDRAIEFRSAKFHDAVQEAEQAKKDDGIGRTSLTVVEREYYREVGFDVPETFSQQASRKSEEPIDSTAQIRETAAAIAGPFAEAMNQAFASFTNQMMKQVDEKLNTAISQKGDTDEENGEETGTRRRGRPAKTEAQAA